MRRLLGQNTKWYRRFDKEVLLCLLLACIFTLYHKLSRHVTLRHSVTAGLSIPRINPLAFRPTPYFCKPSRVGRLTVPTRDHRAITLTHQGCRLSRKEHERTPSSTRIAICVLDGVLVRRQARAKMITRTRAATLEPLAPRPSLEARAHHSARRFQSRGQYSATPEPEIRVCEDPRG